MRTYQTDWLASDPVFYNERTGIVSHNINDAIDLSCLEFHPEGFNNYLDFGYSVFEQTPIKDVKFLPHSSSLTINDNGKINIERFNDPVLNWLDETTTEDDALKALKSSIIRWEKSTTGEIVIPTSGGYDSRLLNLMIDDRSRIRSFTYGVSSKQSLSSEVAYAKLLSELLGTKWEQVELGDFHRYLDDWDALYGISTHAHGMYHMEFYSNILKRVSGGNPFLSGIIGDAWAGSIKYHEIKCPEDVVRLGYSHGLHADSHQSLFKSDDRLKIAYYDSRKVLLDNPIYQVVEIIRFKMILLSYLMKLPRHFGFKPWSPFLDLDIAMKMLTIPAERRIDRRWQKDLFRKSGVDLESMGIKCSQLNTLNLQALRKCRPSPLDPTLLGEVVRKDYVEWVNSRIMEDGITGWLVFQLCKVPEFNALINKIGYNNEILPAYNTYLTLKPIENLLRRNEKR